MIELTPDAVAGFIGEFPYVRFDRLLRRFSDSGMTRLWLQHDKAGNILLWEHLSQEMCDVLGECHAAGRIQLRPARIEIYPERHWLPYPLARRRTRYRKIRWLPCVLAAGPQRKPIAPPKRRGSVRRKEIR